MRKKLYWTNPYLVLLQSRLYSPGYAGPGKWVLLNPRTRKSYNAIGPDIVPDIIKILTLASSSTTLDDILEVVPNVDISKISQLVEIGLLHTGDKVKRLESGFVTTYKMISYNYPFQDYYNRNWREEEERLLSYYDSLWPTPEAHTTREGNSFSLPKVKLSDIAKSTSEDLIWIAGILQFSFGSIGEIPTSRVTCLKKTSPSGGARHPTEGTLIVPKSRWGIQAGAYIYDPQNHSLVVTSRFSGALHELSKTNCLFSIAISSKLERPMWRYRDVRALRPVLLDAGHIIETVTLLCANSDLNISVQSFQQSDRLNFLVSDEPSLALVSCHTSDSKFKLSVPVEDFNPVYDYSVGYITNPAAYFSFGEGGLFFNIIWPKKKSVKICDSDFLTLSHCLPSNRGDRITTIDGILESGLGINKKKIEELIGSFALVPNSKESNLYDCFRIWVRHGWYASLLFHMEAIIDDSSIYSRLDNTFEFTHTESLLTRKTTRIFNGESISQSLVSKILLSVFNQQVLSVGIKVKLLCINVNDMKMGAYDWSPSNASIQDSICKITPETARKLAVGQQAIENAAFVLFVYTSLSDNVAEYELNLIDLGRIGQRICLSAEQYGLGVFMTPAINEEYANSLFNSGQDNTAGYLFALGVKA